MSGLDVYASLHRSEGFGLTMAEAMALGLPVVASGYSGNVDFMQDGQTALLVNTPVIRTTSAFGPYEAGTRWGDPEHGDAVRKLKLLGESAELRQRIGNGAKEYVRQNLTAAALKSRVLSLLGGITGVPGQFDSNGGQRPKNEEIRPLTAGLGGANAPAEDAAAPAKATERRTRATKARTVTAGAVAGADK